MLFRARTSLHFWTELLDLTQWLEHLHLFFLTATQRSLKENDYRYSLQVSTLLIMETKQLVAFS